MSRTLAEIAADLRDRVIELDGLGDFGTARAESVRLLAHDLQDLAAIVDTYLAAYAVLADLHDRTNGIVASLNERIDRLERLYLPDAMPQ